VFNSKRIPQYLSTCSKSFDHTIDLHVILVTKLSPIFLTIIDTTKNIKAECFQNSTKDYPPVPSMKEVSK